MPKLDSLSNVLVTTFDLSLDTLRFIRVRLRPRCALGAEIFFLRKQWALYLERQIKPRRAKVDIRLTLVLLSKLFAWPEALSVVRTDASTPGGNPAESCRRGGKAGIFGASRSLVQSTHLASQPNCTRGRSSRLENIHLLCSVSGAKKEAFAVGDGNGLEGLFRCAQQLFVAPGSVAAQDLFDLAPHGLDGIEVRRIRRQIPQPGASGIEGFPDSPDFVRGQIVQNHHLARAQGPKLTCSRRVLEILTSTTGRECGRGT